MWKVLVSIRNIYVIVIYFWFKKKISDAIWSCNTVMSTDPFFTPIVPTSTFHPLSLWYNVLALKINIQYQLSINIDQYWLADIWPCWIAWWVEFKNEKLIVMLLNSMDIPYEMTSFLTQWAFVFFWQEGRGPNVNSGLKRVKTVQLMILI